MKKIWIFRIFILMLFTAGITVLICLLLFHRSGNSLGILKDGVYLFERDGKTYVWTESDGFEPVKDENPEKYDAAQRYNNSCREVPEIGGELCLKDEGDSVGNLYFKPDGVSDDDAVLLARDTESDCLLYDSGYIVCFTAEYNGNTGGRRIIYRLIVDESAPESARVEMIDAL